MADGGDKYFQYRTGDKINRLTDFFLIFCVYTLHMFVFLGGFRLRVSVASEKKKKRPQKPAPTVRAS